MTALSRAGTWRCLARSPLAMPVQVKGLRRLAWFPSQLLHWRADNDDECCPRSRVASCSSTVRSWRCPGHPSLLIF